MKVPPLSLTPVLYQKWCQQALRERRFEPAGGGGCDCVTQDWIYRYSVSELVKCTQKRVYKVPDKEVGSTRDV